MSKIELLAKIELLNKYEAMVEEMKAQADTILEQHLRDNMGEIITLIDAAANENGYNQE